MPSDSQPSSPSGTATPLPVPGARLPPSPRRQPGVAGHLAGLVLLALVPSLALGGVTAWQLGAAHRRTAEAGLVSTARALATALDRDVQVASTALETLAVAAPPASDADLATFYGRATVVGSAFGGWMALLTPDLRQAFNTLHPLDTPLPTGAGGPFAERSLRLGETVVSDLFVGATAKRPVIAVARPLDPAGWRRGATPLSGDEGTGGGMPEARLLLLGFGPERFSGLLEDQDLGHPRAFAVLTDGQGRVIARSEGHVRFLGQPAPSWYTAAVEGRTSGIATGTSLAGWEAVAAFRRLEHAPGWTVGVTLPLVDLEAAWRGPVWWFALGAAALAAISAILAALLARRLLRPLRRLSAEAGGLRGGETGAAVQPEPIAEFEELRRALRRSAAALRAKAAAEGRAAAAEEAGRRRELLVHELNHRVKNILATVQSIAAQTLRGTGSDTARFAGDFSGRIATLARAHDLLTAGGWEGGVALHEVATAALRPWLAPAGRVTAGGEEDAGGARLTPAQAQAVVLALHELATNATKHGALSRLEGGVELRWRSLPTQMGGEDREPAPRPALELTWTETGGPGIPKGRPGREGFGTRLLRRGLAHDLGPGATVDLAFRPSGLKATVRFPAKLGRPAAKA